MSHPMHPSSERYSVCCSVPDSGSFCSQDGHHISTSSSSDDTPIFSVSKSSVDVHAGSPRLHGPASSKLDKPCCSSTSEQSCSMNTFQNSTPDISLLTKHNLENHSPQALSEHWLSNMQRWSSCSAQSRSNTPNTVIFKGSRPSSIRQDMATGSSNIPDLSQSTSTPPRMSSPPLSPPKLMPSAHPSSNLLDGVSLNSLQFSLLQAKHMSPLPARELLCFTFPSPISSCVSLEKFAAEDPLYAVRNSVTEEGADELFTDILPGNLELPYRNLDSLLTDFADFPSPWRPMLATSFSDPYLGTCCRCNNQIYRNMVDFRVSRGKTCEEGTMTSRVELVDVGIQTFSPIFSWWSLKRNNSAVGSPSILGSPPGSLLNLRSPAGSHFNLVSPSSSMFPANSDDEDSKVKREFLSWETSSNTSNVERRSCLKVRSEKRSMGRRSSMKQVQWDEDGMTWDVHGASIDLEELNMAIQKHLELKSTEEDEKPLRKSMKKKRAPKPPALQKVPEMTLKGKGKDERKDGEGSGRCVLEEVEVRGEHIRRGSRSPGPVQRSKRRSFRRLGWCGGSTPDSKN